MARVDICFECGHRYDRRNMTNCPRCGDERIFIPSLHSESYDITKDPAALLRLRLLGIAALMIIFLLTLNLR